MHRSMCKRLSVNTERSFAGGIGVATREAAVRQAKIDRTPHPTAMDLVRIEPPCQHFLNLTSLLVLGLEVMTGLASGFRVG